MLPPWLYQRQYTRQHSTECRVVVATTGMDVRAQHTTAIAADLAGRYSPATANLMMAAVRGVLRACRRLGLISADDYANAVDLKRIKGEGASAASGRSLSQQERNRLIAACVADASPAGRRWHRPGPG
jgi:hypothetical protein